VWVKNVETAEIDVCIVTYNQPVWVVEAVESVIKQDFRKNFNIFVYDDKSSKKQRISAHYHQGKDGTQAGNTKALASKKSPRLVFKGSSVEMSDSPRQVLWGLRDRGIGVEISHTNDGVSVARNNVAQMGKAPWILFVDGDDKLGDGFLETVWRRAKVSGADIVYPKAAVFVDGPGLAQHGSIPQMQFDRLSLLRSNYIPVTSLLRRSVFDSIGRFDDSMHAGFEDWDLWIRAAIEDHSFVFEPKATLLYRQHDGARSHLANVNAKEIIDYIRSKYADVYRDAFRPRVELV